jgi:hypothetical protein
MKKKSKDYDYTVPVIVIVGLFVLTLLLNAVVMPRRSVTNMQYAAPSPLPYEGKEHLFILDQKASDRISILSAALTQSGFIVISNEVTGQAVGISPLLLPGLYSNRAIMLSEPVIPGEELFATIYTDNGDGNFDLDTVDDTMGTAMSWVTIL